MDEGLKDRIRQTPSHMELLEAEVECLRRAVSPKTLAEAEVRVASLAEQFHAYGAMITVCRNKWVSYLCKKYDLDDGGWDAVRDEMLYRHETQAAVMREALLEVQEIIPHSASCGTNFYLPKTCSCMTGELDSKITRALSTDLAARPKLLANVVTTARNLNKINGINLAERQAAEAQLDNALTVLDAET